MSPESFYRSTLREVAAVIRGANFRREQQLRVAITGAWTTAALSRYPAKKRLPRLESLLRHRTHRRSRQTPEQQRSFLSNWAQRAQQQGLAVRVRHLGEAPASG